MGTLAFFSDDPAILPKVSSNAHGAEPWSGLHVDQLTPELIDSLYRYCQAEGNRQGWNDAVGGRVGSYREGPFMSSLLDGEPYRLWQESYDAGVIEQANFASLD